MLRPHVAAALLFLPKNTQSIIIKARQVSLAGLFRWLMRGKCIGYSHVRIGEAGLKNSYTFWQIPLPTWKNKNSYQDKTGTWFNSRRKGG